jgi:hypothetical protein
MIEKFNFYDVYGYFLPGFALAALLYLPFGLLGGRWPSATLADGVGTVIIAYLVGHVLQTVALHVVPSQTRDAAGAMRFPFDILLDATDQNFSAEFKSHLAGQVHTAFGIDLGVSLPGAKSSAASEGEVTRRRQDAFFLCRNALITGKVAGYPEQFEGMYSLMRGLAAAFAAGFFYLLGWAVPGRMEVPQNKVEIAGAMFMMVAILLAGYLALAGRVASKLHSTFDRLIAAAWMLLFGVVGYLLSSGCVLGSFGASKCSVPQQAELAGIALASCFCSLRCLGAYKFFANEFAKAVWRGFGGYHLSEATNAGNSRAEGDD